MNSYVSKNVSHRVLAAVLALGFGLGLGTPSIAAAGTSDNEVTGRVKEQLAGVNSLKGADIGVKSVDGVVTLSGTVRDSAAKSMAVASAVNVEGVRVVDDELKTAPVQKKAADPVPGKSIPRHSDRDDKITSEVRVLLAESLPGHYKVDVKTTAGVVHLRGELKDRDAIERIRGLVAQMDGVKNV